MPSDNFLLKYDIPYAHKLQIKNAVSLEMARTDQLLHERTNLFDVN